LHGFKGPTVKNTHYFRPIISVCLLGIIALAAANILPNHSPIIESGTLNIDVMSNESIIWMLLCAILVLFMQAGFLLLEAGNVRSKNSINVAQKNAADFVVCGVIFFLVGFHLIFGAGSTGLFGFGSIDLLDNNAIALVFLIYHFGFCATAATIVSGAVAERMKFTAYLGVAILLALVIYPMFAHIVWGNTLIAENPAYLTDKGFIDFAGSTVVHATAAWVALAAIIILGARRGRFDESGKPQEIKGNSSVLAFLGTIILLIGWIGFNAGAIHPSAPELPQVIANTIVAACFGATASMILGVTIHKGIFRPQDTMYGMIGGLVAITAGVSVVGVSAAAIIGMTGGLVAILGPLFISHILKLDDPLDVVAVHGFAGVTGTLLVSVFAHPFYLLNGSRLDQFLVQLEGVAINFIWSFGIAFTVLYAINRVWKIRISYEEELEGLNSAEHGISLGVDKLRKALEETLIASENSDGKSAKPLGFRIDIEDGEESAEIATAFNTILDHNDKTISKLQDLHKQANSANKAKSEFLANMSHEIRTPLNGVMGIAELLGKTKLDMQQKSFVDIIWSSASSLLTIINDILDYSKIEAGKMRIEAKSFDLHQAVDDISKSLSSQINGNDMELIVRIDPSLPQFYIGDVNRYKQVLENLVSNANKFTTHGYILIELSGISYENDMWRINTSIEDTGPGIAEDKLDQIFDKFNQLDNSSNRRHDGAGLGLAITSKLVKMMGGTLNVDSKVDVGSKFYFEFPMQVDRAASTTKPDENIDLVNKRILVVDDNVVNRQIIIENLDTVNTEHVACSSSAEALSFLDALEQRNVKLDAMILDFNMPEMNGAQLLAKIRSNPYFRDVPAMLLSSVDIMATEFENTKFQAILNKPALANLVHFTLQQIIHDAAANSTAEPTKTPAPKPSHAEQIKTAEEAFRNALLDEPLSENVEQKNLEINKILISKKKDNPLDVLIAEDNEVNRIIFAEAMKATGLRYRIVENGEEAVAYFQSENPTIICMDVSMPVMDGLVATRTIREIEARDNISRTPIIGVTAHALNGDKKKCLEAGMDDYLTKPVSPEKLNAKIRSYIEQNTLVAN